MKKSFNSTRHRWSEPSRPNDLRTERTCYRCGMVKVTRHDGGDAELPWHEFHDPAGILLESRATPPCEPRRFGAAA